LTEYYNCCNILTVTSEALRQARHQLQWTQKQAAATLRVSQPYLSLMENGLRPVPGGLVNRLAKHTLLPATSLPFRDEAGFDPQAFAASLGALGYPRFSYLSKSGRRENPAALLLTALRQDHLEPRLTEALPWLLLHYSNLDWEWLVEQVKQRNLQNRLGFLVSLARELADKQGVGEPASTLTGLERTLEDARLAKTDVLSRRLTSAEQRHFQTHRSQAAMHWNLLTGLSAGALHYAE
jgi:transcriptional regulator with XRE-family HTH domain